MMVPVALVASGCGSSHRDAKTATSASAGSISTAPSTVPAPITTPSTAAVRSASPTTAANPPDTTAATPAPAVPATTPTPGPAHTLPGAEAQASGAAVLLTLQGHVQDLPSLLSGARLQTPEEFTMTIQGIGLAAQVNATFFSGQVAALTTGASGAGTIVIVRLRSPASTQSVAVGEGNEINIAFS